MTDTQPISDLLETQIEKLKKTLEMKKYVIRDREAGNEINDFNTYEEAVETLNQYEKEDKLDRVYIENFYEIVER